MKKLLFYSILLYSIKAKTQTLTVSDNSSREKISQVIIYDKNNHKVNSNSEGNADISSLDKSGSLLKQLRSMKLFYLPTVRKNIKLMCLTK
jgi:hypothetical protein